MKQTSKWFALALILVAPLLTIVDVYIINMAIPAIKNQYQTVDSLTELVISAYLVGYCVFLITGSRVGDYYGRKKAFLWGMLGFTLTSALYGWADTIEQLIIFRFFQGIAAALMVPQTLTIMQLTFTEAKERYIPYLLLLYGLGQGIVLPSILNYALRKIPPQYAALAAGVYSTVQQFSSAFGLSIIGSIYFYSVHAGWNGYKVGMTYVCLYLIGVIVLLYRLSTFTDVNVVAKPVVND